MFSCKDVMLGTHIPLGFLKLLTFAYVTRPSKLNKNHHPKKGASHNLSWDSFVRTLTNTESCKDQKQRRALISSLHTIGEQSCQTAD